MPSVPDMKGCGDAIIDNVLHQRQFTIFIYVIQHKRNIERCMRHIVKNHCVKQAIRVESYITKENYMCSSALCYTDFIWSRQDATLRSELEVHLGLHLE